MPGERPPTLPRDLQPCPIARSLGCPSQHPLKHRGSARRTTQGMRDEGSKAQASPEARLSQAREVEREDLLLTAQVPAAQSCAQACSWPTGRMESSDPQLHSLSTSRIRCILDEPPKDLHHEAPRRADTKVPQGQKTRARHRPGVPRAEALPSPEENNSQRCFQEAPSSFTSTNCTSPSATPGPVPRRAPQSSGTSPGRHASGTNLQAIGTNPWPPAAENSFPGANFGVPSAEPKPFPEGSRPSSPQGVSVPYPFPVETVQHERAAGTVLFTFHQPLVAWAEEALGANPACPSLPCNPGQSGGANAPSDLGGALSPPGAAHLAPSPFRDGLHKSLTRGLPEGPPPTHDGLGSPRGLPNPPPQRHFPGQGYGGNGVGTSPASLDTELPTPGPPPTHLPQLWDSTAAPYPTPTLGPAAATRTAFFEGQQLRLPHSPPLPWSPVLTTPGPNSHQMGVLSQLTFPRGSSEWQGDSQGTLGALNTIPRPGETVSALRSSPGQPSSSPRLLGYGGMKDPGTQPLFFGGAQPQVSPQGALSLPPPMVVGASPSESPLPSPATNTASSSTCSSLSPPSSSPANPSSEDSQQPGPLRSSAFYLPPTHSQETSSPFPSPEPTYTLPTRYQSESAKAFHPPTEGPGAEDAFGGLEGAPFSHKSPSLGRDRLKGFPPEPPPPPYSAQHFSLSSANLDQLDVLLTCRQCDRNYSSLTAFLEHRPLCSLLLTKAKDGSLQPPGLPAPTATSKAPTDTHSALLEHNQAVPFLLTRDDQGDSKDDSLRTSFLPGLSVTSFPLPTSDLDMEDDAKLDRLITEALNGMEYQSDNPEIDSSFIDVFVDEEPSGSRAPSAGQPLSTQVGATPKNGTQPQLPSKAAMPEPQTPCTRDRRRPAGNRPKTRSLGLASASAEATTLVRQQRRGKQFKLFRKEPAATKDTNNQANAICLRPRKKGRGAGRPRPQDRKSRARKGRARADHSLSRATSKETRSSKHLQLASGKDSRKRRGRGGSWSKEFIHKIVRQKNRGHRQQAPRNQASHAPPLPGRPPSTQEGRLEGQGCASESEEEGGVQQRDLGGPVQGCFPHSHQRHQGKKRKKEDLTQNPRKVPRQEDGGNGGSPAPRTQSLLHSLDAGEVPVEREPGHPIVAPKHPPQVITTTEENWAAPDIPQEGEKPEDAAVLHPDTTELRERSFSSADCGGESLSPAAPVQAQACSPTPPGSHPETLSGKSVPVPDAGCLLGAPGCAKSPGLHTREDSASQPGRCLVPTDKVADAFYTESSIPVFRNSSPGCDPDHCDRRSTERPVAKRGPLPDNNTSCELFFGSKDLASCFPDDLYAKPLAVDPLPAHSCYLSQDSMETLESTPPKSPPYPVETDPGKAHSPLTLESTSLFAGLPEDGFDPPLYDSLSANRVAHVSLTGPDPLPKKPLADPLYPPFLLLEEVSPMMPGSFAGLSKGKTFSKNCPSEQTEQTESPSPTAVPEKGGECSLPLSNLCEDELEIKRLVTELESQLQGRGTTQGALGEPEEATREGEMDASPKQTFLLPTNQAASPQREPAGNLTGFEGASSQQEGALRYPQKQWSYPVSCHTEKPAPSPGTQEDPGSGAPLSPEGFTLGFQRAQEAMASNTDSPIPLSDHLPDPRKQRAPSLHAESPAKFSPKHQLLFSKNNEARGTQNANAQPLLPGKHTRGHSPDPAEAQEPCPSPPALEGFDGPNACLALEPNSMLKGDEDVTSLPSAGRSHDSKGHLEDRAGSSVGAMLYKPIVRDSGLKGESVPAGTSPLSTLPSDGRAWSHPMPDPPWELSACTGQGLQEPACCSFPLLQALDATAKGEDNTQGLQPGDPSATGRVGVEESSLRAVKMSALPADTRKQPRSKADGHLGSPSEPEKTKGQNQANRLWPKSWKNLENPDEIIKVSAHLEARPARGRRPRRGNRAARGLRRQALFSTSPTCPDGTSLIPIQKDPAERSPEKAAGPQPLLSPENPTPSNRGLATIPQATPTPSELEPIPQEDPGARVKPIRPPTPSSHRDLPSPDDQPTCPDLAPLGASHDQATKDAEPPAAPTLLVTSYYGPEEASSHHTLLGTSSPKDPPLGSLGSSSFSTPVLLERNSPKGITVGTLEDSRKEELKISPAHSSPPPPGDPSSPKVTIEAAPLTRGKDDLDSGETLEVPDPHCMGVPTRSNPERTYSKDPSLGPQSNTHCPGRREGRSIMAVPTDLATPETTGPDSHICQEDKAGDSSKEQDNPGTPGTRYCEGTKVARASARSTPTGLHLALDTPQGGTSSDFRSDSPQDHMGISHHPAHKGSSDLQDHKRRPRGLNKKPEPAEKTPAELPETCQLCSASFRSKAGLSRHKARKHRPHRESRSLPSPVAVPACQPPDPMTKACQTPGKKNRKVPGKGRPSHPALGTGPPPFQVSTTPEDTMGPEILEATSEESEGAGTLDTLLSQHPPTPGLTERGESAKVRASKPRRPDRWQADQLHPKQMEVRGQRQDGEPANSPSHPGRKPIRKRGELRARRQKHGPRGATHVTSDGCLSDPTTTCGHPIIPLSLSPEGECRAAVRPPPPSSTVGPRALEDAEDTVPGALRTARKAPQEWRVCQGTVEKDHPVEQKATWTQWFWGPEEARAVNISGETSQAIESQPAEDGTGVKGRSDGDTGKRTPDLPDRTHSLEIDSGCPQGPIKDPETLSRVQGCKGATPDAPCPDQREPPDLFDDEVSFSRLFPLDGRLTQKNLRVYGKRCHRPKCPSPKEPTPEVLNSVSLDSTRLPTDLSDSGSLCLSREEEDLWDDEVMSLPESLLLDGLLSNKTPGLDPWTPSLSLWALESNREASCVEEEPSCFTENQDEWSEPIPQLHMVPAAWRDLEPCSPACETASSVGDMSPEPPNLEREHDNRPPGNTSLPPRYINDFEVLSTQLEIQDLCFLGPCDDLADLPNPGALDFQATANTQGPPNKRMEGDARIRRAKGRDLRVKGRRASYKCRVCFQRFHSLGELDLHKLSHSPSPPPTCYMCVERRFSSRELLREHLWEKHVQGKAGPWACGMCLKEVADVWMYNQHLREHAARFARNGQALRTLGDLPGCLEEESTLTHFLNTIVEQASKPQRTKRSIGKASGEPSEQEGEAGKKIPRRMKRKARASVTPSQDGAEGGSPSILTSSSATSSDSAKTPPTPSPDPWSHSDSPLQAVPVHEDCKDPSRDCHHCGKQFPKPFKLQRHLAVHSPQRVYLCPQCPQVYPEHWELRVHLGLTHGVTEEKEIPHVPLYACELCANVMHVIRRSFVCSSCNYTFAKKEQFDRHMDKHLRSGQQPFTLRSVKRPGVPRRKTHVSQDVLPSKQHRQMAPSSTPELSADRIPSTASPTPSEVSLPALPLICSETAPSLILDQSSSQERPMDQEDHSPRGINSPVSGQDLPPPSLSPFSAASAEGTGGCTLDRSLEKPEHEASLGGLEPCKWQALVEGKRALHLFSGKHRSPGTRGKCAPGCSPGDPSQLQERIVTTHHTAPEGRIEGPSQKRSTTKPGACSSTSKHRPAEPTKKALKLPAPPRKPVGMGIPAGELLSSPEDRVKPNTSKGKLRSSSQSSGGLQPGTQTGGGSQPQPTSGQLQSEMASTPTEPSCPSWASSSPDQPPPRAHTKGSAKGPGEPVHQGLQVHSGPREKRESHEKQRKGQAPGLGRHGGVGNPGKASSAPDKSSRAPRKQATPSRVPPVKSRPSGQSSRAKPQPSALQKGNPGHTSERGSFPQVRPLSRPYKRVRAVHGAEPMEPRDHRTAEAQSDLLSQLFGQKLAGFKIPLKKDSSQ